MINFEIDQKFVLQNNALETIAINMMRRVSRELDENEHEIPWDYINFIHMAGGAMGAGSLSPDDSVEKKEKKGPRTTYQMLAHQIEMLSWGDAGMYLCTPAAGLGGAAVQATGTPEQKARLLPRLRGKKPAYGAMAITEAGAGSDTSAIRTRAVLDKETNEWVLNGEKIFVTAGHMAMEATDGFVVVWATIDPEAGRRGIRPFVVEADSPGAAVTKLEDKLGIRASDTATIALTDCRIPFENILGSPEVVKEKTTTSYKGAMKTFDNTRPLVSASAMGVARAALELVHELLENQGIEIRYHLPRYKLTALEHDVIEMEIMHRSGWLLILKAVWMADNGIANTKEASMCKVRAGDVATRITQKAVEIMGPLGYSREFLLEKWFRDAKINDIFEGTGQINRLIVARNILGYRGSQLR